MLFEVLREKDLLKTFSVSDVLTLLSYVRKINLNNKWVTSEICKKSRVLIGKLNQ